MPDLETHPAIYALGICYHAAQECRHGPLELGWGMWCVLSHLYGLSDRQRLHSYRGFWKALKDPHHGQTQADTMRSTYAVTAWHGLLYSVGLPASIEVMKAMYGISAQLRG